MPSVQAASLLTNSRALMSLTGPPGPCSCPKPGKGTGKSSSSSLNGGRVLGDWNGSVPHGRGSTRGRTGGVYDGEWSKGERHGVGLFVSPSGGRYKGDWEERADAREHPCLLGKQASIVPFCLRFRRSDVQLATVPW